jgi:hypothetical protein
MPSRKGKGLKEQASSNWSWRGNDHIRRCLDSIAEVALELLAPAECTALNRQATSREVTHRYLRPIETDGGASRSRYNA